VVHSESFVIDGPNGRHICLVLPVLGPSASELSDGLNSRFCPSVSRQAGYKATKALADLHAQGVCHGGRVPHFPALIMPFAHIC
jgi:serine/threonine-protein kinase SRPK3